MFSPVLSFEEARRRVLDLAWRLSAERVALDDACGRVLAKPVLSTGDMPAFDYSAMDGYAVATSSWPVAEPCRLPVHGESRAGGAEVSLAPGTTCRIFTGARVPDGADAVVMQENVEREGETALFRERPKAGANIRRRGEDLAAGATAIAAGTRLRPSHVGLAASCDHAWLDVARRPTVTLIGTGDELRAPGLALATGTGAASPSSIPESNGPALRAMAMRAGAIARVAPFAPDDRAAMARAFEGALRGTDLLVSIGGVSVGDHDLVRPVLEDLGASIDFWKVAIKPGKPLVVGRRGDAIVLGLPGNPVSAMVTFALFGVPLLRSMQGDTHPLPAPMRARLARDVAHQPGRMDFLRVTVARDGELLVATPLANQSSGAPTSMAHADALLCIDAERGSVKAGETADILWMDELCA
jgi:molybdopterin molybdotransferase